MWRSDGLVGLLVGVVALVVLVGTASHIGLTYDEPIYMSKSMLAYDWVVRLLWGVDATSKETVDGCWDATGDQQPGSIRLIFGLASGTAQGWLPLPPLVAARMGTMLLAAALIGVLYWLVAGLWDRAAGLVAAGALLLMPRVWTHMHLAALDAPIMALSFITVALIFLAARRDRPWLCVAAGVMFGLALGTKLNSFFIPFIVLPWLLYIGKRRIAAWTAGALVIVGPLTFWATWPWLWYETWSRFSEYFAFHLHHYHVATTYFGTNWELAPWHYAPVMTAMTMPPVVLALAVLGIWVWTRMVREGAPRLQADETASGDDTWRGAVLLLLAWGLVVNIVPSMLPWAPKYNGVRLFLPVFPYIAGLAGVGFWWLSWVVIEYGKERWGAGIAAFPSRANSLLAVLAVFACVVAVGNCHPFGMSYYSSLVGGPSGAHRLGMEPTYWGDTYLAGVGWLNENAEPDAVVWINVVGFASSVEVYRPLGMMRGDLQITAGDEQLEGADYVVVQHKPSEMSPLMQRLADEGKPLFVEALDGVALLWVFSGDDVPDLAGR